MFVGGTFDFVSVYSNGGYFEKPDDSETNVWTRWYYDKWFYLPESEYGNTYAPLDDKYALDSASLKAVDVLTDVNTALEEAKIRFITGSRPLSEWDDFLDELGDIGMNKIIEEKTEYFNKVID
jgi:hypothetical protein